MIRRLAACLLVLAAAGFAQEMSQREQDDLRRVLSEAPGSPVDLIRALESHLARYPDSPKKDDIERAITKAAIQIKDAGRVAAYGERVLEKNPGDLSLYEALCRTLAADETPEAAKRTLKWSKQYEQLARAMLKTGPEPGPDGARRQEDLERMLGHSLLYQAIATATLGDKKTAAELARASFDAYPNGESAAELGKLLVETGRLEEGVRAYADAFTVPDPQATDADRAAIRRRMGEAYQRLKGSETGLGDIVLQAYDRNAALMADRRLALKKLDPNLDLNSPTEFTLTALDGDKLSLSSLAGKVIVMDFWATWCGPCRAQHPLYEELRRKYAARSDVVFLSINTDEDRTVVKPFLEEQKWKQKVYFEDGLSSKLRVASIPTTIIFGKNGEIVSRVNGFNPATFVDVVSRRIDSALGQSGQ